MAKTAAERQAERRDRIQKTVDDLSAANATLTAENAALRAELDTVKTKLHQLELDSLKTQLRIAKKATKTNS
jgi:regulator of replication initiation timing